MYDNMDVVYSAVRPILYMLRYVIVCLSVRVGPVAQCSRVLSGDIVIIYNQPHRHSVEPNGGRCE